MPISKEFKEDLDRLSELIKMYEALLKKEPGSRLDSCVESFAYDGVTWELYYDQPYIIIMEEGQELKRIEDLPTSVRVAVSKYLPNLLRQARKCNADLHGELKEILSDLEQDLTNSEALP